MDDNTVRELERELAALRDEVRELRQMMGRVVVRPVPGGGRFSIATHTNFPAIPSVPTIIDCKDQLWYADASYTVWRAMIKGTTETGEVGT